MGAPAAEGSMDWVGTALLMGLAAALSASATLALLCRREIVEERGRGRGAKLVVET